VSLGGQPLGTLWEISGQPWGNFHEEKKEKKEKKEMMWTARG